MLQWLEDAFSSPAFSNQKMEKLIQFKKLEVQKAKFCPFLIFSKKAFFMQNFSLDTCKGVSPDLVRLKNNIL